MKTSLEWYQKAIFDILKEKENLSDEIFLQNMLNAYLQAKEIEKEQIKSAFTQGDLFAEDYFNTEKPNIDCAENYYNETFKQ
jgi:hypothetical protein